MYELKIVTVFWKLGLSNQKRLRKKMENVGVNLGNTDANGNADARKWKRLRKKWK
jgi:hypothetical protein